MPRKVVADKLPEQFRDMLHIDEEAINDESFIERNCELHENYMANLRAIREGIEKEEQEKRERQKQLEQMMNFKKARGSNAMTGDQQGSVETLEKDAPVSVVAEEKEEEIQIEDGEASAHDESALRLQSKTPVIDEEKLAIFDARKQKISNLIVDDQQELALEDCSKPVRDVMKVNYGVHYAESVSKGGKTNCTMGGQSVYDSPKRRNMKLDELKEKQEKERATKIQVYIEAQGYLGTT